MNSLLKAAEMILAGAKEQTVRLLAPVLKRIEALEQRPAAEKGKDGKDADPEVIRQIVAAAVEQLPKPRDGKDVDVEHLRQIVQEAVASLPKPEAGKNGENGKDDDPELIKRLVSEAIASLPKPKDGEDGNDADPEMIRRAVADAVAALPKAKDGDAGADAYQVAVAEGFEGTRKEWLESLRGKDGTGKDGEDGRDAWQIEVIDPDPFRSYARGVTASFRCGLIRAFRTTDPLDGLANDESPEKRGWHVILNGISAINVNSEKDLRNFTVKLVQTSGKSVDHALSIPAMIYRNVWRDHEYEQGDTVTWAGSLWHADRRTKGKPGEPDSGWTLAAKRGRDGKDFTRAPVGAMP